MNNNTKANEFAKVWKEFWNESVENPDEHLLKYLEVNMQEDYEPIRNILDQYNEKKLSATKADNQIRQYFKGKNLVPKISKKKSKAKKKTGK